MKRWQWLAIGAGVLLVLMGAKRAVAYVLGRAVEIDVLPVGNGASLEKTAAQAFYRMQAAAKAVGLNVRPSGPRAGFRTPEDQEALVQERGAFGSGGFASTAPIVEGKASPPHLSGRALDIEGINPAASNFDPSLRNWLLVNAHEFGWVNAGDFYKSAKEPWHWEWRVS